MASLVSDAFGLGIELSNGQTKRCHKEMRTLSGCLPALILHLPMCYRIIASSGDYELLEKWPAKSDYPCVIPSFLGHSNWLSIFCADSGRIVIITGYGDTIRVRSWIIDESHNGRVYSINLLLDGRVAVHEAKVMVSSIIIGGGHVTEAICKSLTDTFQSSAFVLSRALCARSCAAARAAVKSASLRHVPEIPGPSGTLMLRDLNLRCLRPVGALVCTAMSDVPSCIN